MGLYSNSSLVFVFSFSKRLLAMSGGHYRGQRRLDDEVVMRPTHKRSRARTRQSQPAPASCGSDPEASGQSNFILLSGRRQNSFVCPLTLSRCQLELVSITNSEHVHIDVYIRGPGWALSVLEQYVAHIVLGMGAGTP